MGIWQWYMGMAPKSRMILGAAVIAYAGAGMYFADKAEEKLGLVPTEKDKKELREAMPKLTMVERGER